MDKKHTFDFSPPDGQPVDDPSEATPDRSSEFFIDGWDAYREWLDELCDQLD